MDEEVVFYEYYENLKRQKPSLINKNNLTVSFECYYDSRDIKGLTVNQSLKRLYDATMKGIIV